MYKDILLPIDLSQETSWKRAVEAAVAQVRAFKSRLHVMTVVPDSGMAMISQYFSKDAAHKIVKSTHDALHAFVEKHIPADIKVQHIVTTGNVYESIIDIANKIDVDLIIMAAHRPELKDYLLGPNAARVVRHSDKSVLVVRN